MLLVTTCGLLMSAFSPISAIPFIATWAFPRCPGNSSTEIVLCSCPWVFLWPGLLGATPEQNLHIYSNISYEISIGINSELIMNLFWCWAPDGDTICRTSWDLYQFLKQFFTCPVYQKKLKVFVLISSLTMYKAEDAARLLCCLTNSLFRCYKLSAWYESWGTCCLPSM